jgi:hypothetical protein
MKHLSARGQLRLTGTYSSSVPRHSRLMITIAVLALALLGVIVGPVTTRAAAATVGAPVPFTEYDAVNAATNGTILAPDYYFGSLASEATGRQAVQLIGQGKYVSFTLTAPANAVDFHYAIPDSLAGTGLTDPLDLYVNGTLTTSLSLTSDYSWLYGSYPFTNTPSVGEADTDVPHDFYNDVRYMFSSTLPAGTVVKLQVDAGDDAPWYAINTADFEVVPAPLASPAGYINVTQAPYNVDNTGATDVTTELQDAIDAAETAGTGVYLPAGTYQISQQLFVNNVSVVGAGEWYTELTGTNVEFAGQIAPASTNVTVSNLSIFGNINVRNDGDGEVNGFNGGFSNSTISNVWIQNTKVGVWIVGPATNLTITGLRIQDTTADGINFNAADGPITDSTIEDNFLRNTQDDGIALWSENAEDSDITITQNTVDSPGLANNIGIYGSGDGDVVSNNLLQDTVTRGGGIGIGQRFTSVPMNGTLTITGNDLVRTGQFDPGWNYGVGAIWFWPQQGNMNSTVNITDNTITDSPYEAFQFQNENGYVGSQTTTPPTSGYTVSNVNITGNTVNGVGTFVFQDQAPGSVTVSNTTATGVGDAGVFTCGSGFTLNNGGGNSGFTTTTCGMPASSPLWVYPTTTTFETATVGQATPTQQIAIMNTGSSSASLGTISASSGFTVSQDPTYPCGSSLAPTVPASTAPWCMVDVSFTAPAAGITTGTLTINSNQPGSPATVQLVGSTGSVNNVINPPTLTPSSLAFGYENVGSTSSAQTTTVTNPGQSAIAISSVATTGPYSDTTTCGSTLAAGASCTVSVKFTPTASGPQNGTLAITNSATATPVDAVLTGTGLTSTTNLALSATMTASGYTSGFPPSNANDGNTSTYWESTDSDFPQWLEANFGTPLSVGSITVDLPPSSAWATRTQTFSILGSTNGSTWTTLVASAGYTFNPATGNTVTISLPTTTLQYLELNFTANTGWPAGQVSELEVFEGGGGGGGTGPGSPSLSASPTSLSFGSQTVGTTGSAQTVTVTNSGTAAASISSVSASGPFAQTNTCGASLAAGGTCTISVSFAPAATGPATGTLTVTSNDPNSPLTVSLSGTGTASSGSSANLALGKAITASSSATGYPASDANDGNSSTYWESLDGSGYPQTLTVDLGASVSLTSIVLDLPPSGAWSTRTQTLSVLGSTNGSSYSTVVASAGYTFNPSTGNTVTITLPSGTSARFVELSFTNNTGWSAAQLSEFEIFGPQASTDLVQGVPIVSSSTASGYPATNAVDGNTSSYWESQDGLSYPQTLTAELPSATSINQVVLDLPPSSAWSTRTETLSVLGSTNGSTYTTLVGSATYTFNPATGNTVTITFTATSVQYLELQFTANSGWSAAQLAELEAFS